MQTVRLTQIVRKGHDQRSHRLHPISRRCSSPCCPLPGRGQPYDSFGRRVDFCERGGGSAFVWFMTAKVSAVPSPKKPPPLPPKKNKVLILSSSLLNESALVTDSVVDSDTYEMFCDTGTIPNKAHAPMPPNPLSPSRTRVSSPNSSLYVSAPNLTST